jgi:hypothetical protein
VSGNFNAATASGNVGIGTTAPASKLHIDVDGTALRITRGSSIGFLYNTGTASTDITRLQSNGGSVQLYTAGGTATLDASGNLGLGVTPSAWGAGKAIEVGFVGNSLYGNSSNNMNVVAGAYFNSGFKYAVSSLAVSYYNQSNGAHAWLTAPSGTAGNAITFTQAMTLDASGNLGIGTTSPWEKLSVPFNAGIALGSSTYSYKISRSSSGELVTTFSDTYDASTARVDFVMRNGAPAQNTALSILGTGNVGIGTTSPSAPLDVVSDGSAIGLRVRGRAADNFGLIQFSSNNAASDYAYIGSPSANQIAIYTNGFTERMRIDSAGNVGIGATSVGQKLLVRQDQNDSTRIAVSNQDSGSSADSGIRLGSFGGSWDIANGSSAKNTNALTFGQVGGSERMRIDSAGNVGIGATSPSAKLEVGGSSGATATPTQMRLDTTYANTATPSNQQLKLSLAHLSATQSYGFALDNLAGIWYHAGDSAGSTGAHVFATAGTERMRINSAGNVGIGTSSPASKLEVKGTGFVASSISGDSTSETQLRFLTNTGARVSQQANQALIFDTNATERMRIDSAGNVGIGATSPDGKLMVVTTGAYNGSVASRTAIQLDNTNVTGGFTNSRIQWTWGGVGTGIKGYIEGGTYGDDYLGFGFNTTERMRITSAGDVGIGVASPTVKLDVAGSILASGNVTAYSDIRVKDNVESIEGAIGKLNQIRGVTYTRTDLDDKHRRFAGVIAQEIEQVLPEAVFDNGKVKAVDYNATIALLIEAVKEQQGQINELKLTIEQLKGN